jgi:hypothetical protein
MQQALDSCGFDTRFISGRIVGMGVVHVDQSTFRRLPTSL